MDTKQPKVTVTPPLRIPVPDGKGGTEYVDAPAFDVRLSSVDGTRRGIVAAPDPANLQSQPTPASKR